MHGLLIALRLPWRSGKRGAAYRKCKNYLGKVLEESYGTPPFILYVSLIFCANKRRESAQWCLCLRLRFPFLSLIATTANADFSPTRVRRMSLSPGLSRRKHVMPRILLASNPFWSEVATHPSGVS